MERAAVANDLADYLGVDRNLVLDQFKRAAGERKAGVPTPRQQPKTVVPALERILLNAVLSSATARAEVLAKLDGNLMHGFVTREIWEVMGRENAGNGTLRFQELEGRLSESARALLHEISAADEIQDEEECLKQARECLKRLRQDLRKRGIDELRASVKMAERAGNMEEAMRLMQQLMQRMSETDSD